MHWLFLFIAILFEVTGTTALKASGNFTVLIPSIITVISYCISFYCLSLSLLVIPVGIAYAIWSGFGIVIITLIGYYFFNQSIDIPGLIGIIMILTGVLILNLISKTTLH